MSDYFRALIRTTGLKVRDQAALPSARQSSEVDEHDEEVVAALEDASTVSRNDVPPPALTGAPEEPLEHRPSQFSGEVSTRSADSVFSNVADAPPHTGSARSANLQQTTALSANDHGRRNDSPAHADGALSDSDRRAAIRAAMRWVAENGDSREPTRRDTAPAAEAKVADTPPGRDDQSSINRAESTSPQPLNYPTTQLPNYPTTQLPPLADVVSPALRYEQGGTLDERPNITPVTAEHSDVIEITIGAIHLHVDAPATKTVAVAQQTPPSRPQQPRPARSGLARRYLRSL